MSTLGMLRAGADHMLLEGELRGALAGYAALVQLSPVDLDARLRVADALLAMGEVQRAAVVYTSLARFATHAGYPLRALVALKVLAALEPQLSTLIEPLAELYSVSSPRLGRGVRLAPAALDRPLPEGFDLSRLAAAPELVDAAARLAADWTGAAYPQHLPPVPLLSELSRDAFAGMLHAVKLKRVRPGEEIVREGEAGHSFFVVARGEVQVTKASPSGVPVVLASLHEGAMFGEMALVSAAPRSATVSAKTDADLLEFDREALTAASSDVTTLTRALDKFARERLLHNLLQTSPIFRPLDRGQRLDLARRFAAHDVPAGTVIIAEGQPGRGLFILLSGEADVSKVDGNDKVLLATLKPGDVFGEISLLHDELASATVTAAAPSTVLVLHKDVFARLMTAFPAIREYVSQLGEERSMDTRLLLEAGADELEIALDDPHE